MFIIYKLTVLYRNVYDRDQFVSYHKKEIAPRMLIIPGVMKVTLTSIQPLQMDPNVSQEGEFCFMGETFFVNKQAFETALQSQAAMEAAEFFLTDVLNDNSIYIGNIYTYNSLEDTESNVVMMHKINDPSA